MKQLIFSLILLCAFTAYSQDSNINYRTKFTIGAKAGLNFSNVFDTKGDQFQADPKIGIVLGGFVAIPIDQLFGLQTEFLISQKGFKGRGRFDGKNYDMIRTTTFIDIPLMVTLKPAEALTLMAGPQLSVLVSQRDVFVKDNTLVAVDQAILGAGHRRALVGFIAGADINIEHFVIGARVAFDAVQSIAPGTTSIPRYRNVWYQGTIGFRF